MNLVALATEFWWAVLISMISTVLFISYWEKVKWFAMNFWYSFPLVGKLARLSRDDTRDHVKTGWLKSERVLCADYKKFIGVRTEAEFFRYNSYLERAGDIGRKPLPAIMWFLIIAMVIVEALGFSYVLAGYTIPGASEAMQSYGALGIAFLISVLLVFLTHHTGSELYVNGKVKEARTEWKDAGKKTPLTEKSGVSLANNHEDDDKPHYTQMAHRVGKQTKHIITILTAVFVISVAVGATYVRGVVLEKQLTIEVSGSSVNYFDMPSELAQIAGNAETKALEETKDLDMKGGWTTFVILATIFVFLQILGVILGYKYGFAGRQSKEAYLGLGNGKFHTYEDVLLHTQEISDTAQAKLETLQQKLEENNSLGGNEGIQTTKTFANFLLESEQEQRDYRQQSQAITSQTTSPQKTQEVPADVITIATTATPAENIDDEMTRIKAELEMLQKQKARDALLKELEQAKQAG
ncbi:MAG: hypothetical protein IE914_07790 [Thiotrichales bacterium]|nr:hypothetical protein [Thiotrichales bacterium]